MKTMSWDLSGVILCLTCFSFVSSISSSPLKDRIAVIQGKAYQAFLNNASSKLLVRATSTDGHSWSWTPTGNSAAPLSNPSAMYVINSSRPIQVALQAGVKSVTEPYLLYGNDSGSLRGEKIGSTSLPSDLPGDEWSPDSVVIKILHKDTFVFARSQTKQSHIYWTYRPENGSWSPWKMIGDSSDNVKSDPAVAINTYLNRFEVFVLLEGGTLVQAWQDTEYSFSGWHGGIGDFPPTFDSTPAVRETINRLLQVFVRGTDRFIYHIPQTTCDKVNNPWGPCTWSIRFTKLGDGTAPGSQNAPNPISVGVTIHGGLEVFMLDDDGHLWRVYQLERGKSWTDWENLGPLDDKNSYGTIPSIFNDESGWWNALSLGSVDNALHTYTQPRSISADDSVTYGSNLTVRWRVPVDDVSRMDWLGIYPQNAPDNGYVDFRYVGGGQNPGEPVDKGTLPFLLFLPDGTYDVRYMVGMRQPGMRKLVIMQTTFTTSNQTDDPEWVQLYRGIALGLGNMSQDYIKCVQDGNHTIETFKNAFKAFENRDVIEGLHLFAQGLSDVSDAIIACGETPISQDLLDFIKDLISCESIKDCADFVIEVGEIILIYYENEYEIYGDILAADNSFKLEAYEQGGLSIGRVTYACLNIRVSSPHKNQL